MPLVNQRLSAITLGNIYQMAYIKKLHFQFKGETLYVFIFCHFSINMLIYRFTIFFLDHSMINTNNVFIVYIIKYVCVFTQR